MYTNAMFLLISFLIKKGNKFYIKISELFKGIFKHVYLYILILVYTKYFLSNKVNNVSIFRWLIDSFSLCLVNFAQIKRFHIHLEKILKSLEKNTFKYLFFIH